MYVFAGSMADAGNGQIELEIACFGKQTLQGRQFVGRGILRANVDGGVEEGIDERVRSGEDGHPVLFVLKEGEDVREGVILNETAENDAAARVGCDEIEVAQDIVAQGLWGI